MATYMDLGDGSWLYHAPGWADGFDRLRGSLAWEQVPVRIMGREVMQPRLTAWYGDPGMVYRYSGRSFQPHPWVGDLGALRARLQAETLYPWNACLANLYRDGRDSIGLHADDEPELGPLPQVASVSLGSPRKFVLRHNREKGRKIEMMLGDGALLIMGGTMQHHWKHEVPKTRAAVGERLNLTFRQIKETCT